jgi:hypothetical protein
LDNATLENIVDEFVNVSKKDLQHIKDEYQITGTNEFNVDEKEEINKAETEIFNDLDDIEINYVNNMSSESAGKIYYSIATLYMENYKLSESMFDTKYISERYEEAGKRFKKISAGVEGDDKTYAENVANIGGIISELSQSKQGLSGNDADITEDKKIEYWNEMKSGINFEENTNIDNKQINMNLIVSSILWLKRADYSKLSGTESGKETVNDIYDCTSKSVEILNQYISANSEDEESVNQVAKVKYTIENYSNASPTITGKEIGGTNE